MRVDTRCPYCGAGRSRLGRAAGAVAVGLALGGCPAEDDNDTDAEQMTESGTTSPSTSAGSLSTTTPDDGTTIGPQPAYGVGETGFTTSGPETETGSGSGTDTDTDTDTGTDTGSGTDSSSSSGSTTAG